jgi:hypothetical protein
MHNRMGRPLPYTKDWRYPFGSERGQQQRHVRRRYQNYSKDWTNKPSLLPTINRELATHSELNRPGHILNRQRQHMLKTCTHDDLTMEYINLLHMRNQSMDQQGIGCNSDINWMPPSQIDDRCQDRARTWRRMTYHSSLSM